MPDQVTEPVVDPTATAPNVDPTPSVEPTVDTPTQDANPVDPVADKDKGDTTPGEPTPPPHMEDLKVSGIEYDGVMVDIDIPVDMANFAQEHGFDATEIAKEMYSPEGLSDETRAALNEAFGKWQVDTFLEGVKAKDTATMSSFKDGQAKAEAAATEAWEETLELMGGEDRWADLSGFAEQNLSEEEINEFNEVMKNGSMRMQKLMIADLWSKFDSAGKPVAPVSLDLEDGSNNPPADDNGAVTQAEYFEAFKNGEYRKDPQGWDARRQAGMAKGI
jgi:hypothetical protein